VQNTVHIAKTWLLKPSIMLPMWKDFPLEDVPCKFWEELHGLRLKDIDLKDKQNFDAIVSSCFVFSRSSWTNQNN